MEMGVYLRVVGLSYEIWLKWERGKETRDSMLFGATQSYYKFIFKVAKNTVNIVNMLKWGKCTRKAHKWDKDMTYPIEIRGHNVLKLIKELFVAVPLLHSQETCSIMNLTDFTVQRLLFFQLPAPTFDTTFRLHITLCILIQPHNNF